MEEEEEEEEKGKGKKSNNMRRFKERDNQKE